MKTSERGIALIKQFSEEWKPLPFSSNYAVSTLGNVRGPRGQMTPYKQMWKGGYTKSRVGLCITSTSKQTKFSVGYLVLLTFVGERPAGMQVCHNNGDATDNRLENLRWDTPSNNQLDRRKHGTDTYAAGECNGAARLTESQVLDIYRSSESQRILAEKYNTSQPNISAIKNGKSWRWLTVGAAI